MTQYSVSFTEPCRWHHVVFDQHYATVSIPVTPKSNTDIHSNMSCIYKISNRCMTSNTAIFKRIRAVFLNGVDNFLTIWMIWNDSKYASIYERMAVHMYVHVHICSNTVHKTCKKIKNLFEFHFRYWTQWLIRTISASTKQAAVSWPE